MNPHTNLLKPEAEARVRSKIGSISGVAIQRLTAETVKDDDVHMSVVISVTGWSPSLNRLDMHWRAVIRIADIARIQGDDLLDQVSEQMVLQRRRLDEGLALGTAAPFGVSGMDGTRDDTKWGHILVDRGLATLFEDARAGGFDSEVSDSVFDLHQEDHGERDGTETHLMDHMGDTDEDDGIGDDEDGYPIAVHGLFGRELRHDVAIAPDALYDGSALKLRKELPDTVLAAAPGRTLSSIADVPPAIADRTIVSAERHEDWIHFRIEPVLETAGILLAELHDAAQTT